MTTTNLRPALPGTGPVEVTVTEYGTGSRSCCCTAGRPGLRDRVRRAVRRRHQRRPRHRADPSRLRRHAAARGPTSIRAWPRSTTRCWTSSTSRRHGHRQLDRRLDRRRDRPPASPRVSGVVLVDAVGIEVPGHPIADFFALTMDQVFTRSFHNPETVPHRPRHAAPSGAGHRRRQPRRPGHLRRDGDELPDPGRTACAPRLPTLVLWGEQRPDRRPRLRPRLRRRHPGSPASSSMTDTGHLPQLETPEQVLHAIWDIADTDFLRA